MRATPESPTVIEVEHRVAKVIAKFSVLNVLVADDEFANLEAVSEALAAAGHRVFRAGDGVDALRLLSTYRTDVVVCNEQMSNMAGGQLVSAMEADPRFAKIPVIMMVEPFKRGRMPLPASAAILHKPVMIPQLLALVDQVHRDAVR